jgi:hypothetical protein
LIDKIEIVGLRELRKALGDVGGKALKTELRSAHKAIADRVAGVAQSKAPVKTGALRASIKGLASQTDARIREGKATVPYYGFIDFGGSIRLKTRNRTITRPFIREGRIIYPAIRESWAFNIDHYSDDIDAILRKAGLL